MFSLANKLRSSGFRVECDHVGRSVKAQFKYAGKLNVRYVAVIGSDEAQNGTVQLKNMNDGTSDTVSIDEIAERIR